MSNVKETLKLNVLLATTEVLKVKYKNMINNFTKFFATSQGAFVGIKNTYTPKPDTEDVPSKRKYQQVTTTVDEKFEYFMQEARQYVAALFAQERSNAMGIAIADLVVDGKSWGTFTSLELLRLKSLIESADLGNLGNMLDVIPVRTDAVLWDKTKAEEYTNRKIFETPVNKGVAKTTEKEQYIMKDPNVTEHMTNYVPQTAIRTTVIELGDYTNQHYSGEWSQREKAEALRRKNILLVSVVQALKKCNECESLPSALTADIIFGFIFNGKS